MQFIPMHGRLIISNELVSSLLIRMCLIFTYLLDEESLMHRSFAAIILTVMHRLVARQQ
jgi:hypothetical protein